MKEEKGNLRQQYKGRLLAQDNTPILHHTIIRKCSPEQSDVWQNEQEKYARMIAERNNNSYTFETHSWRMDTRNISSQEISTRNQDNKKQHLMQVILMEPATDQACSWRLYKGCRKRSRVHITSWESGQSSNIREPWMVSWLWWSLRHQNWTRKQLCTTSLADIVKPAI